MGVKMTIFTFLCKALYTENHDNFYGGDVWKFMLLKEKS